jgi:hypothetical protein
MTTFYLGRLSETELFLPDLFVLTFSQPLPFSIYATSANSFWSISIVTQPLFYVATAILKGIEKPIVQVMVRVLKFKTLPLTLFKLSYQEYTITLSIYLILSYIM